MILITSNDNLNRKPKPKRGFTLVELLVSIAIVTILASTVLFAMAGVTETARVQRTRSQINRINELITSQWESYETRRVKFSKRGITPTNSVALARRRLEALREVQRMEMPDRYTDLISSTSVPGLTPPSLWHTYRRKFASVFGRDPDDEFVSSNDAIIKNQGAEMLYLILAQTQDGNASALEFFQETEVGDTDGDGMLEILDGWGTPISFLRWAPGAVVSPMQPGDSLQAINELEAQKAAAGSPDPFDMRGLHNRIKLQTNNNNTSLSFGLFPLIYSAGPDKKREIRVRPNNNGALFYCYQTNSLGSPFPNDPFYVPNGDPSLRIGAPFDSDGDGDLDHVDNITNHFPGT